MGQWADFASRAKPIRGERTKVETLEWRLKALLPLFPTFPVFLVPRINPLLVFDDLNVFRQRGTKNTGYAWLIPCYVLVTRPHGRLSNRCWADYSDKEIELCELGGLEYLLNPCILMDT